MLISDAITCSKISFGIKYFKDILSLKLYFKILVIESKTLQGSKGEHSFNSPGAFVVENTTVEFQRGSERQAFKIPGPLMADFIFKVG